MKNLDHFFVRKIKFILLNSKKLLALPFLTHVLCHHKKKVFYFPKEFFFQIQMSLLGCSSFSRSRKLCIYSEIEDSQSFLILLKKKKSKKNLKNFRPIRMRHFKVLTHYVIILVQKLNLIYV